MLRFENIAVSFGGIHAVQGLSFEVTPGEVFGIIGPNGAGKTTVFNLISRIYSLEHGRIFFGGRDISRLSPHRIARIGIARTFQNTELFVQETVLTNLLVAHHAHSRTSLVEEILFLPRVRRQEVEFRERVERVIDLLQLQRYRSELVGAMPYGARKMVEIARALCLEPKVLLLDEPSSGLSPEETEEIAFWIEDINKDLGITVLMVEHDMNLVNQVSDRVLAIADGKFLALGTPQEIQNDPRVQQAYFGD